MENARTGRAAESPRALGEPGLQAAIAGLGIIQLALGAWQAVSPGTFFKVAGFGVENVHYIRDISTLYLALGLALLVAARRPVWRVPILAFGAIEYGLHFVNHLHDVGHGHPGWVGPADAAAVGGGLVVFLGLLAWTRRSER